jgi:catechol 2,3-dioxygenase-like lactoylglutathione lyase family enzyme
MFNITDLSHVAAVVVDLDQAMYELSEAFELDWLSVQKRTMTVRRENGEVERTELLFTYSRQGPPHLELLQGTPGSIWGPERAGLHHIGVWADDFVADVAALEQRGMPVELTLASRDTEDPRGFTYHRSPHGLRVELVSSEARPMFDRWLAGGDFG